MQSQEISYHMRNKRLVMPTAPSVFKIRAPLLPQFCFEWHVVSKTVYLIRLGATPLQGDPIATNVPDHGSAINTVAVWTRGYREGSTPTLNKEIP